MELRKLVLFMILITLLIGIIYTPVLAEQKLKIFEKDFVYFPDVIKTTYTVCASGCDFSSIQDAIAKARDGDVLDLAAEIYTEGIIIDKDINLIGEGADNTIIQAADQPGVATSRVINIKESATVSIQNLTIQNGVTGEDFPDYYGGGIYNQGNLIIDGSVIADNYGKYGGGITNWGTLTVTNSTISFNASVSGGGILNSGNLSLLNASIFSNTASSGGGIANYDSVMTLNNCTISGNFASYAGGGVLNHGEFGPASTHISSCTIAINESERGANLENSSELHLSNSIVVSGQIGTDCRSNVNIIDDGFNFVGDGSCGFPTGGNPFLAPLNNNGGPTWTHALLPGSPVLDAIPPNKCANFVDQRGAPRPYGEGCDIGAFETVPPIIVAKTTNNIYSSPGQVIDFTIQVTSYMTQTISGGQLLDNLPSDVDFIGPIKLIPIGSGNVGSLPPSLATNIEISEFGQYMTLTFPVRVKQETPIGTNVTNIAWFTCNELTIPISGETTIIVVNKIYLPIAHK